MEQPRPPRPYISSDPRPPFTEVLELADGVVALLMDLPTREKFFELLRQKYCLRCGVPDPNCARCTRPAGSTLRDE